MKIYLAHSTAYDYRAELYEPLRDSFGDEHELFLPHETHAEGVRSKDIIAGCDLVLAEVSLPSTGQGIELGWADASGVPIICFHKAGSKPSGSLRFISVSVIKYHTSADMISKLRVAI